MDELKSELLWQKNRYKQLLHITKRLHSAMEVNILLGELFVSLKEIYPDFSYYLLLSRETHIHSDLPIIDLEYDSENITAINAYVSGTIQFENSLDTLHAIIYAPLIGKQGVYGVLQIIATNTEEFPKDEVEFITLLAGTAGSAFENAQLYQQSRREISNLELINETSHRLNSNLRLADTMTYMSEQIISSFNAQEVGFFLISGEQGKVSVLPGSTSYFLTNQAQLYIDKIRGKIQQKKDALFIGDINLTTENRITSFHSIIAIPMIESDYIKGFTIIMHQKPYFFSFATFKLLQSLVYHSSLALTNSMLREELEHMIITDHLTKLHSRKYLDERIQCSMKEDMEGTFILLDLDDFKEINDTYGHQIGDEVLIQIANIIKSNIRDNDVGARWGGEELALYLPQVPFATGVAIAKRLVEKVSICSGPPITVSCGVSYWSKERQDTYISLFKRADEALYCAKVTGKNKVVTQEDNKAIC